MVDGLGGTTKQVHLSAAGWARGPIFHAKRARFTHADWAFAISGKLWFGHENSPLNSTPTHQHIAPQLDWNLFNIAQRLIMHFSVSPFFTHSPWQGGKDCACKIGARRHACVTLCDGGRPPDQTWGMWDQLSPFLFDQNSIMGLEYQNWMLLIGPPIVIFLVYLSERARRPPEWPGLDERKGK
jgi:hypothetical protein